MEREEGGQGHRASGVQLHLTLGAPVARSAVEDLGRARVPGFHEGVSH